MQSVQKTLNRIEDEKVTWNDVARDQKKDVAAKTQGKREAKAALSAIQ